MNLTLGSKGPEVVELCTLLGLPPVDTVSKVVFDAIVKFQKANKLHPDGIVGPLTWARLKPTDNINPNSMYTGVVERFNTHYLAICEKVSKERDVDIALIFGIMYQESRCGLGLDKAGTGDYAKRPPNKLRSGTLPSDGFGFGRGLMQIDWDSHVFARGNKWKDPEANIRYGVGVFCMERTYFKTFVSFSDQARTVRLPLAAYNCGRANVLRAIKNGRDAAIYTAGHDYPDRVIQHATAYRCYQM